MFSLIACNMVTFDSVKGSAPSLDVCLMTCFFISFSFRVSCGTQQSRMCCSNNLLRQSSTAWMPNGFPFSSGVRCSHSLKVADSRSSASFNEIASSMLRLITGTTATGWHPTVSAGSSSRSARHFPSLPDGKAVSSLLRTTIVRSRAPAAWISRRASEVLMVADLPSTTHNERVLGILRYFRVSSRVWSAISLGIPTIPGRSTSSRSGTLLARISISISLSVMTCVLSSVPCACLIKCAIT
mmetsp:Transcript_47739/g.94883  ORF Transcript_47739/g.94883 Transcript_47739/m.94883 type:complete len:241 (-) Transcript_47739:750-1472(-)